MEEFPSNAHKETVYTKKTTKVTQETVTEPEKKVEQVTSGQVVVRKTPMAKKFLHTFFGGDAKSVVGYVVMEVLIPAAKDMVADAVSQGVERTLFGEVKSASRRTGARPSGSGYTPYNRFSSPATARMADPREREVSSRARSQHDFGEIILATRVEADHVIDRLYDLLEKYEQVTVADLYDLVGVSGNYTDDKWGWERLSGAGVTRTRNGYLLNLPAPEPLK